MSNTLLLDNELIDVQNFLLGLKRPVVFSDITELRGQGYDPRALIKHFFKGYPEAHSNWSVHSVMVEGEPAMTKLVEAAEIMRSKIDPAYSTNEEIEGKSQCYTCKAYFNTFDAMLDHKVAEHGYKDTRPQRRDERPGSLPTEGEAVIANTTATKGIDISGLPDGRYALPDRSGDNDYIFIMVKRIRRTFRRDRRYVFGKVITGGEIVEQGTIEVKLWSSDSKELVGEQRPGDCYRGDLEDDLILCMSAPEPFAVLFGKLSGHCCVCGKTLTDEASRAIGMGIECERKTGYFTERPENYHPLCPHEDVPHDHGRLGKVVRFDASRKETIFRCHSGHSWTVKKDGVVNMDGNVK
jgi:hypothetical protein